jgi:hypothetical protein
MLTRWALPAVTLLLATTAAEAQPNTSCAVSANQFANIEIGMPYAQVARTLGCGGEFLSESEVGNIYTSMYGWRGSGVPGANMTAIFQNGRLAMKAQSRLGQDHATSGAARGHLAVAKLRAGLAAAEEVLWAIDPDNCPSPDTKAELIILAVEARRHVADVAEETVARRIAPKLDLLIKKLEQVVTAAARCGITTLLTAR